MGQELTLKISRELNHYRTESTVALLQSLKTTEPENEFRVQEMNANVDVLNAGIQPDNSSPSLAQHRKKINGNGRC